MQIGLSLALCTTSALQTLTPCTIPTSWKDNGELLDDRLQRPRPIFNFTMKSYLNSHFHEERASPLIVFYFYKDGDCHLIYPFPLKQERWLREPFA